jgi:hypothetical protein
MKLGFVCIVIAFSSTQACTWGAEAVVEPTAAAAVDHIGNIRDRRINEASGIVASRNQPDLFWTHNDGNDGVLYAIRRDGSLVSAIRVDEKFKDWEDIAADDEGHLYLADTGNNSKDRKRVMIYRIAEPDVKSTENAAVQEAWKLGFPVEPFDCESLFIWQGHGYVISKHAEGKRNAIYRFPLTPTEKTVVLQKVVELPVDEPVTAADISRDGRRLAVLTRRRLSVFCIEGKIESAATGKCEHFSIPPVPAEGCCFADDGIVVVAETGEIYLARQKANATTSSAGGTPDRPSPPASGPPPREGQSAPAAPTR